MVTPKTHDSENAYIAAALTAAKENAGMTFDQLAALTEMSSRSAKRYLADERVMTVKHIRLFSRALGVDYLKLLVDSEGAAQ